MQEGRADSWEERIRWIVDTHESGDTESERMGKAAEKLGVSREAVRLMCKGKSTPGGDTLAGILRAYPRVSPAWLLTGTGPRERPTRDSGDPYLAGQVAVLDRLVTQLTAELADARRQAVSLRDAGMEDARRDGSAQ